MPSRENMVELYDLYVPSKYAADVSYGCSSPQLMWFAFYSARARVCNTASSRILDLNGTCMRTGLLLVYARLHPERRPSLCNRCWAIPVSHCT